MGKGQATSVHTGTVAVAAAWRGRPNHANAAASTHPSKAAATAIPATLLIAPPSSLLAELVAGEIRLRRGNLSPLRVGVRRQRHELLIVLSRRGLVTERVGCLGS